jgi:alpha-tubulin suppressor-like RCC1 family protein
VISDGAVRCWGKNQSAQLGDGTLDDRSTASRVVGSHMIRIDADSETTCAVGEDHRVRCWGRLANQMRCAPLEMDTSDAVDVALRNGEMVYALRADGSVWREPFAP